MSVFFNSSVDNSIKLFMSVGADFNEVNGFLNAPAEEPSEGVFGGCKEAQEVCPEEAHPNTVVEGVKTAVFNKLYETSLRRKESEPVLTDKPGGGIDISYSRKYNPLTADEKALLQIQANTLVQHATEGRGLNSRPLNLLKCNFARLEATTAQEIVRIATEMGKVFKRVQDLQESKGMPSPVSVAQMSPIEEYEECKAARDLIQSHIAHLPSSGIGEMIRDQKDLLNGQSQSLFEKIRSLGRTLHIRGLAEKSYRDIQFKEEFLLLFNRLERLEAYPYGNQIHLQEALAECELHLETLQSKYQTMYIEKQENFNRNVGIIREKIEGIQVANNWPRKPSSKEIMDGEGVMSFSYPSLFSNSVSKFL
jgi:hypothetical protein